jgi:hypothetical protein
VSSRLSLLVMTAQARAQPGTWTTLRSCPGPARRPAALWVTATATRRGWQVLQTMLPSARRAACQLAAHHSACGCRWGRRRSSCERAAAAGTAALCHTARPGRACMGRRTCSRVTPGLMRPWEEASQSGACQSQGEAPAESVSSTSSITVTPCGLSKAQDRLAACSV